MPSAAARLGVPEACIAPAIALGGNDKVCPRLQAMQRAMLHQAGVLRGLRGSAANGWIELHLLLTAGNQLQQMTPGRSRQWQLYHWLRVPDSAGQLQHGLAGWWGANHLQHGVAAGRGGYELKQRLPAVQRLCKPHHWLAGVVARHRTC